MKTPRLLPAAALALLAAVAHLASAADDTWTGGGSSATWSDGANWSGGTPNAGDNLIFSGSTQATNTNDTPANTQYGTITFDAAAGPFVITGSALNVGSDITNNQTSGTQILGTPLNAVSSFGVGVVAGGNLTFNGAITGSGVSITKTGNGILNVTGAANGYSGGWVLNQGTLRFGASQAIGTGATLALNGGTLDVTGGNTTNGNFTLSSSSTIMLTSNTNVNVMTGSGNNITTTSNANVLTFNMSGGSSTQISFGGSAANAFSNFNGTLAFAPGSAGAVRFGTGSSGGTYGNTSMKVSFGSGSTTRLYARNSGATINIGELSGAGGNISSGNGTQTINVGALGTNTTYGGIFTQSSGSTVVNKNGAGVLTLTGVNTHSGNTTINGGTLVVNGSITTSTINVTANGTLAGSGIVATVTTNATAAGGKISPGDGVSSFGTLTGSGLTWGGSSDGTSATFFFDLGSGNVSDGISLSGALTKGAGTKWIFDFGNTGTLNNVYTLITFGSTTFTQADVTSGDLSFVNLASGIPGAFLTVGSNSITLSAVPEPATWALILGCAGLGLAVWRRRAVR